jgi:hypothetical protein
VLEQLTSRNLCLASRTLDCQHAQAQIGSSPESGETVSVRLTGTKLASSRNRLMILGIVRNPPPQETGACVVPNIPSIDSCRHFDWLRTPAGGRLPCGFRFPWVLCADSACWRYFRLKNRREKNAIAVEGWSGIGGTAKATAALSELTHAALMLWLITQVHECGNQALSLKRISRFSPPVLELEMQSQHCNSRSVQIRNVTESCRTSPPERDSGCPLAASGNNRPHRIHFQGRWFPARMGFGRDGNLHVMAE